MIESESRLHRLLVPSEVRLDEFQMTFTPPTVRTVAGFGQVYTEYALEKFVNEGVISLRNVLD